MKRALVLGGTGSVGSAVVRALVERGLGVRFTFHTNEARARELVAATGAESVRVDLTDRAAYDTFLRGVSDDPPAVAVHCVGASRAASLEDLGDADWDRAVELHARSAFALCRALVPAMGARGGGDIVLVGALAPGQTLPLPVHLAASQGMLGALAMSVAKEAGARGVRVNLVALGILDEGMSRAISVERLNDYKSFSALRRVGTAAEAARVIAWLALENAFMTGRTVTCNGGV
jgi:3-oxoacyl-[acyl-carrier protein] reductase